MNHQRQHSKNLKFFLSKRTTLWTFLLLVCVSFLMWVLIQTIYFQNTGFEQKTLWDWMDLLIVPLLIPISVLVLAQRIQQTERRIAVYKTQKEDQQAYFDRMTELLLKHALRTSPKDSDGHIIARTRTLSVLPNLTGEQKGHVLLFLYKAGLIYRSPIIDLEDADLRNTILVKAEVSYCHLKNANLQKCNLSRTKLFRSNFQYASMQEADLSKGILNEANFIGANLSNANLRGAALKDTKLAMADLTRADFTDADLTDTNLNNAELKEADFTNAVLINTKLKNAKVTTSQLEKARELINVTLPDGKLLSKPQTNR